MTVYNHKLLQDIYDGSLKIISNTYFSRREIDIIACLLNGRSAKGVGNLLSIAPRTVETHTRNITLKLEKNSREGIRDFIEKSGKLSIVRDYYDNLLIQCAFEKRLRIIAAKNKSQLTCLITYQQQKGQKSKPSLISQMEGHLKILGITPLIEDRENFYDISDLNHHKKRETLDYRICVVDKSFLRNRQESTHPEKVIRSSSNPETNNPQSLIFLVLSIKSDVKLHQTISDTEYIDYDSQKNYYALFFEVLKRILPREDLDAIILDFKREYNNEVSGNKNLSTSLELEKKNYLFSSRKEFFKQKKRVILSISLMGIFCLVFLVFKENKKITLTQNQGNHLENTSIRSDLVIPIRSTFLNRSELINQINDGLKENGEIQTVALIGLGGSGKTTLARQYAHQQKANVIWEINAETNNSIIESFENLAYALSKTEEDKGILCNLQEIKNISEREKKLLKFVKERLMLYSNWFLIYDNVENFTDIQKYFPLDIKTWGHGRVIITSRDSNIQNNKHVNNAIQIGVLNESQKTILFSNIMNHGTKKLSTSEEIVEQKKFLETIPPFPLDISVAAYYLKATNVSYKHYIEKLKENSIDLTNMQEEILKEFVEYKKTRYSIISTSVQRIIDKNKDFTDLLLLISTLDSQNIPKKLLDMHKSPHTVDHFIYHLKKHSLLMAQSSHSTVRPIFSIHRSTQAIILTYFTKKLNLQENKNNILIQSTANTLANYVEQSIDKEDLLQAKQLIRHLEMFLSHDNLLPESTRGLIESELGCIYSSLSLPIKAINYFENALLKLRKNEEQNHYNIARNFIFQGYTYYILLDFKKSKDFLIKSIKYYEKYIPNNNKKIASAFLYLGNIYKGTGEYEKAKHFFHKSLSLYEKLPPHDCTGKPQLLSCLGDMYKCLGNYKKAMELIEESIVFCRKYLSNDSVRSAWSLLFLGIIYCELGNYEKAINIINESHRIFEKNFSENSISVGASLLHLSKVYSCLGNYKKAIDLATKSIVIFKKFNSNTLDLRYMYALGFLGNAYKGFGDHEKAKDCLTKSLISCERQYGKDHIESAQILENLGQVHILEGNLKMADDCLRRALGIFEKNKHPDAYKCLESFSDLHLKQYKEAANNQLIDAKNFKIQAINDLKKALENIKMHFPVDSPHRLRVELKIKKLDNGNFSKNTVEESEISKKNMRYKISFNMNKFCWN